MRMRWSVFTVVGLLLATGFAASARQNPPTQNPPATTSTTPETPRPGNPNGWMIPPEADQEKNPLAGDAKAIAAGKTLFDKTCKRCHGPGGKGDGPDADPDSMQDMDLTVARRANRNPDGIVFYKVWNGRKKPKMPAQKDELTKDQVWQIVSYVQTLRAAQ
jgi:mono/diheme cytochrome c family protein